MHDYSCYSDCEHTRTSLRACAWPQPSAGADHRSFMCRCDTNDFIAVNGGEGATWYAQLQLVFRATLGFTSGVQLCFVKWLDTTEVPCPYPWLARSFAAHKWAMGLMGVRRRAHLPHRDVIYSIIEPSTIIGRVSIIQSGKQDIWLRRK